MTREEEIKNAARSYISGDTLSSPSILIHFANGAGWADEHPNLERMWHHASEEPKKYPIICEDEKNRIWIDHNLNDYIESWDMYVEFCEIVRWAYVKDLLPKGGKI